jgi:hypothetical protein
MNRMQEWLARAAKELDVRIIVGYVAHLPDGNSFPTQALFPDLGAVLGTIVLDSAYKYDAVVRHRLLEQGFTISTFSEPLPNEEFDLEGYAEMFSEWGWTGDKSLKPEWMS